MGGCRVPLLAVLLFAGACGGAAAGGEVDATDAGGVALSLYARGIAVLEAVAGASVAAPLSVESLHSVPSARALAEGWRGYLTAEARGADADEAQPPPHGRAVHVHANTAALATAPAAGAPATWEGEEAKEVVDVVTGAPLGVETGDANVDMNVNANVSLITREVPAAMPPSPPFLGNPGVRPLAVADAHLARAVVVTVGEPEPVAVSAAPAPTPVPSVSAPADNTDATHATPTLGASAGDVGGGALEVTAVAVEVGAAHTGAEGATGDPPAHGVAEGDVDVEGNNGSDAAAAAAAAAAAGATTPPATPPHVHGDDARGGDTPVAPAACASESGPPRPFEDGSATDQSMPPSAPPASTPPPTATATAALCCVGIVLFAALFVICGTTAALHRRVLALESTVAAQAARLRGELETAAAAQHAAVAAAEEAGDALQAAVARVEATAVGRYGEIHESLAGLAQRVDHSEVVMLGALDNRLADAKTEATTREEEVSTAAARARAALKSEVLAVQGDAIRTATTDMLEKITAYAAAVDAKVAAELAGHGAAQHRALEGYKASWAADLEHHTARVRSNAQHTIDTQLATHRTAQATEVKMELVKWRRGVMDVLSQHTSAADADIQARLDGHKALIHAEMTQLRDEVATLSGAVEAYASVASSSAASPSTVRHDLPSELGPSTSRSPPPNLSEEPVAVAQREASSPAAVPGITAPGSSSPSLPRPAADTSRSPSAAVSAGTLPCASVTPPHAARPRDAVGSESASPPATMRREASVVADACALPAPTVLRAMGGDCAAAAVVAAAAAAVEVTAREDSATATALSSSVDRLHVPTSPSPSPRGAAAFGAADGVADGSPDATTLPRGSSASPPSPSPSPRGADTTAPALDSTLDSHDTVSNLSQYTSVKHRERIESYVSSELAHDRQDKLFEMEDELDALLELASSLHSPRSADCGVDGPLSGQDDVQQEHVEGVDADGTQGAACETEACHA